MISPQLEDKNILIIESLPEKITLIEPFFEYFRTEYHISDEIYGNILVAVTEAVNNAILHGNKEDGNKSVSINVKKSKNVFICCILDEGEGFDFNNVPDPTSPENIESAGGRGVFLMKNLSDLVIFSNKGSAVEIQFKL